MTVEKNMLRRSLAITLALALGVLPGGSAFAAAAVARPVVTSVVAPGGAAAVMSRVTMPSLSLVSGVPLAAGLMSSLAPTPTIAPTLSPALSPAQLASPAPVAAPAVERHPVLGLLNELRARGVELPETVSSADAPAIAAIAAAMPEGASKQEMLAFAASLTNRGGAVSHDAASAASGRLFDGLDRAGSETAAVAAPKSGLSKWIAPLARALGLGSPAPAPKQPAKAADPREYAVALQDLRWTPSVEELPATTKDLRVVDNDIVGQDEALKALKFGLKMGITKDGRMDGRHYNVYVSGPDGSGRETALRHLLSDIAPKMQTPGDIVAATNFDNPHRPVILDFAPGTGAGFVKAIRQFVQQAQTILPKALEEGQVGQMKKQVMAAIRADFEKSVAAIQEAAKAVAMPKGYELDFVVKHGEQGTSFGTRLLHDGEPVQQGADLPNIEEAMAKMEAEAPKLQQMFLEHAEKNNVMMSQAAAQIQQAEAQGAAQVIETLAQGLLKAIAPKTPADPKTEAFQQKVAQWQKAFDAKVAAVDVEGFGLLFLPTRNGVNVAFTHEGKPVAKKTVEQLIGSGKMSNAQWATIQDRLKLAAKGLMQEMKTAMEAFSTEGEALGAAQPQIPAAQMAYVQSLANYAASHYPIFLGRSEASEDEEEGGAGGLAALLGGAQRQKPVDPAEHFRASLLVNNARTKGAPVIWERNPSYENLFGMADDNERIGMMGLMPVKTEGVGGPTLKAGSFHKANGGFLILNVMDVLREPGVWPSLMRAVRNGDAEIAVGGLMGAMRGRGMSYSVPAKVKVVLVGSPYLRMLLAHNDEDFGLNFQSAAEFEPRVRITGGIVSSYAQVLKNIIASSAGELLDFETGAIARVLEAMSRSAGDHNFLDASFGGMVSLVREASFWARESGRDEVRREDVETALKTKQEREETYRRHLIDTYKNNVFVVETEGSRVGQINGLAVMGSFGVPMRVTIQVSKAAGGGGIVSVDRNAGSTGKSFNKALGVVEGFLEGLFARETVFPARISVSYEQNYGGIDGDSATSTEIYGILSALSGVGIGQNFAVTGSADQFGNVQAIGGVNEKIEGYFELAKSRGLDGKQGIIIPRSNVRDLNLAPEVAQAVAEGKFHIYAVDHVSQGLEILTGVAYSEIVERAEAKLRDMRLAGAKEMAQAKKSFGR